MGQPPLHDLVATAHAPVSALGEHSGQIRDRGVQGVYFADRRVLSAAVLAVDGREPLPVADALSGPHAAVFVGVLPHLGDGGPDPTVRLVRTRRAHADGLSEEIRLASTAGVEVHATLTLDVATDLAPMTAVRDGRPSTPRPAVRDGAALTWSADAIRVRVEPVAADTRDPGDAARPGELRWDVVLAPRGSVTIGWRVRVATTATAVVAPGGPVEWSRPEVTADDSRLARLLARSLDDLEALRLTEPDAPGDTFIGAGVPWYLTLFGRDSLWAARMMLPLGTDIAAGTLRALARRQGTRLDARSAEAPGKILHELRYGSLFGIDAGAAPAAYYGTIDATPLWINLLHDAWRWGLPGVEVEKLLPHLQAALGWLADHADPDGDGFLEYFDASGRGLANQGWKDSSDAIRFHDGRMAAPPVALCEVQAYAYQAAASGAAMLDAFGMAGGDRWREWAAALADRFRARFWVDGPDGPYPALALDRDKRPVDALSSNIGHLLGTGLLTGDESALVARHLTGPSMAAGFGLRTMSDRDGGFRELSYHCGSVWPHDTAIAIGGLARDGYREAAYALADGLLAAGETFGYRLPELYGGDARGEFGVPVAYPAACRPQAWSAAASVAVLVALLGLEVDVPGGSVRVRDGHVGGAVAVHGLRVGGVPVDVTASGAASSVSGWGR